MSTTGHENEAINVQGLKASLQKFKDEYTTDVAYLEEGESSAVIADFDPQTDTVWKKAQTLSNAEKSQVKTNLGLPQEIYSKTEVNNLITTPNQQYVTVATYASLPASGSADTIYRVSNYNGSTSQVDPTMYSEYAWNGTDYEFLCVKSQVGEVFDITAYNSNTKYADLSAALGTNGANIPEGLRKGGMSVKFVLNSDNKYVQYRLMSDSFNTTVANWQGVDDELVSNSNNLAKSGAVAELRYGKSTGELYQGDAGSFEYSFIKGHNYRLVMTSTWSNTNFSTRTDPNDATTQVDGPFVLKVDSNEVVFTATNNAGYLRHNLAVKVIVYDLTNSIDGLNKDLENENSRAQSAENGLSENIDTIKYGASSGEKEQSNDDSFAYNFIKDHTYKIEAVNTFNSTVNISTRTNKDDPESMVDGTYPINSSSPDTSVVIFTASGNAGFLRHNKSIRLVIYDLANSIEGVEEEIKDLKTNIGDIEEDVAGNKESIDELNIEINGSNPTAFEAPSASSGVFEYTIKKGIRYKVEMLSTTEVYLRFNNSSENATPATNILHFDSANNLTKEFIASDDAQYLHYSGFCRFKIYALDGIEQKFEYQDEDEIKPVFILDYKVVTNGDIGSTIAEPAKQYGWKFASFNCENIHKVIINNIIGGNGTRAWCFVDWNMKILSHANADASYLIPTSLPIPENAKYCIINCLHGDSRTTNASITITREETVNAEEYKNDVLHFPSRVLFGFDHDFKDVSWIKENIRFWKTYIMDDIDTAFGDFVTNHSSYITKIDTVDFINNNGGSIEYPEYARLNGQATEDYEATPDYNIYMYKVSCQNIYAGNADVGFNAKHKLLIFAGTHGIEIAACGNLTFFAKQLLECTDVNFFKLLSMFDVYIVPYVNGYGIYHGTRYNANKIDFNRNYPVKFWTQVGTLGDTRYSGTVAGSEFETQLIMNLINIIKPDIAIDHHAYWPDSPFQFYSGGASPIISRLAFRSLVDCSFAFVKNMPEYFGDSFKLFMDGAGSEYPSTYVRKDASIGYFTVWCAQNNIPLSVSLEMNSAIGYQNGQYVGGVSGTEYSEDAFKIGEYTLRNQVFRYAQWILDKG